MAKEMRPANQANNLAVNLLISSYGSAFSGAVVRICAIRGKSIICARRGTVPCGNCHGTVLTVLGSAVTAALTVVCSTLFCASNINYSAFNTFLVEPTFA